MIVLRTKLFWENMFSKLQIFLHCKSLERVCQGSFFPSVLIYREERISGSLGHKGWRSLSSVQREEDFESSGGDEIRVTLPESLRWSQMLLDQRWREREWDSWKWKVMRTYCFPSSGYSQKKKKKAQSSPVALGLYGRADTGMFRHSLICCLVDGVLRLEGEWGIWQVANN